MKQCEHRKWHDGFGFSSHFPFLKVLLSPLTGWAPTKINRRESLTQSRKRERKEGEGEMETGWDKHTDKWQVRIMLRGGHTGQSKSSLFTVRARVWVDVDYH